VLHVQAKADRTILRFGNSQVVPLAFEENPHQPLDIGTTRLVLITHSYTKLYCPIMFFLTFSPMYSLEMHFITLAEYYTSIIMYSQQMCLLDLHYKFQQILSTIGMYLI
jgi:hypothetical protein